LRFYSSEDCELWLANRHRCLPDAAAGMQKMRIPYPKEPHGTFGIAQWISHSLTYRQPTLLWVTEWGIWPSSENWHLYYKLRQSYSDQRLLHEAPGHLFLEHEAEDLASFLQLAITNGWGGYILTEADYVNAFFSHDEFIDFFAKEEANLAEVRESGF
jgi:hypothetical protein